MWSKNDLMEVPCSIDYISPHLHKKYVHVWWYKFISYKQLYLITFFLMVGPYYCPRCGPEMDDGLRTDTTVHITISSFTDYPLSRDTTCQVLCEGFLLVDFKSSCEEFPIFPQED